MSIVEDRAAPPAQRPVLARHRPEIDGLRGLAVALVVGYHVTTGRVSGGVDVFLVLSGFFLVTSLGGQVARTGRVAVAATLSRTLWRLVPTTLLVLAATVVASAWVMPESRWREVAEHLVASVLFVENANLVREAVDYEAANALASPVQHLWSLSIQVQVLVATPLLVGLGVALLARRGWAVHGRAVTVAAVLAVTAASFAWSVVSTASDQQAAYFSTLPRLWELGVGALVALLVVRLRPGRRTALVVGWAGVIALLLCGAVLDGAERFPGWQASWPVLCAVAVLVAREHGGPRGVHRPLSWGPSRWLGKISFALYLWHWPVLVLYLVRSGREVPSVTGAAAVVGLSLLLAASTQALLEGRARAWSAARRPAAAAVVLVACAAPLLLVGVGTTAWLDREAARAGSGIDASTHPGAAALTGVVATGGASVELLPPASVLREDWPRLPEESCTEEEDPGASASLTQVCVVGPDDAERRVVVVGDSHAAQWLPPIAEIGAERSWQVVSIVRGGCNLSTESEFIQEGWPGYEECVVWRSHLVERVVALEPDLVVTLGSRTDPASEEVVPPGFVAAWQQLSDAGVRVVAMRDSPRQAQDTPDCVARLGADDPRCSVAPSAVYADGLIEREALALPPEVSLLDTRGYFCDETSCPPVIGNVRVYLDGGHVTSTYMRTTAPLLERDLLPLIGW